MTGRKNPNVIQYGVIALFLTFYSAALTHAFAGNPLEQSVPLPEKTVLAQIYYEDLKEPVFTERETNVKHMQVASHHVHHKQN